MTDASLILQLSKAIQADKERPTVDQQVNSIDPVAIEILLHEADFAVDKYMEKFTPWRERFQVPSVYDDFIWEYKLLVRREIKRMLSTAQWTIADGQENFDDEEDGA